MFFSNFSIAYETNTLLLCPQDSINIFASIDLSTNFIKIKTRMDICKKFPSSMKEP